MREKRGANTMIWSASCSEKVRMSFNRYLVIQYPDIPHIPGYQVQVMQACPVRIFSYRLPH